MATKKAVAKKENKKDWKPIIIYAALQIAAIFIGSFASGVKAGIDAANSNTPLEEMNIEVDTGLVTAISIAITGIIFVIFCIMYRKKIAEDFKRMKKKQWLFVGGMTALLLVINFGLTALFEALGVEMTNQSSIAESMGQALILTILGTVVFAPVVEELVFRYSLDSVIKNRVVFIIVSSLIFGLMHGIGVVTILYVILGLFFVMCYLKTDKNIVASMTIHFINNLIGVIGIILSLPH